MAPASELSRSPAVSRRLLPALLLGAAGLTVACAQIRYTEAFYPDGPVTRIELTSDAGVLELVSGDRVRVERAIRGPEGTLQLSHQVVGGVLTLEARCTTLVPCAVDTTIQVPAGVEVVASVGSGEVWATGIGALQLDLGQGDADLDVSGPLEVRVGSGDVHAHVPSGSEAHVTVADGDIEMEVRAGAWRVTASAPDVQIQGVEERDDARGRLDLVAPAGRIVVQASEDLADR